MTFGIDIGCRFVEVSRVADIAMRVLLDGVPEGGDSRMKITTMLPKWVAAFLAVSGGMVGAAQAADPFLVGVISPMTGPMAAVGTSQTAAIQWWAQFVNGAGGIKGRQVQLDICDDQGNPEIAVTCLRRQRDLGVAVILDDSVSSTVRAITPMLDKGPVMIVSSPIIVPKPDSFVFQTSPTDLEITKALLAYLQDNKIKKLAMIGATDTSGEANIKNAQSVFPPAGVELSLARIDPKSNDASIQLANIVKDNPIIYSAYSGSGAATVIKSFTNLGLSIPFVISNANLTAAFMALIKNDMPPRLMGLGLNMLVPDLVKNPKQQERIATFQKSFEAWKGQKPSMLTLLGLTLADTAESVLKNVDDVKSPAAVRGYLESASIDSAAPMKFTAQSHIGMGPDSVSVMEYKSGQWTKADPLN
jgi:branched-chain amino acid transport system substrate-binding protein